MRYSPFSPLRIPRVHRSLSVDDLYQRFHRNPPTISRPPSTPSPQPHSPRPPSSLNQHARLSTRLPDPPVFTATNANVPFDDWKIRILDKLAHNSDHYPSESFKLAYVISRLGGEAAKYITLKQRQKSRPLKRRQESQLCPKSGYCAYITGELLDQLTDLYKIPLYTIYQENYRTFKNLIQQKKQPFPTFYTDFKRYSNRGWSEEINDHVEDLKNKLSSRLRRPLIERNKPKGWTWPEIKEYLINLNDFQRDRAEQETHKKAQAFAAQYARAKAESDAKRGIRILARSNSDTAYETDEDLDQY